AKSTEPMGYLLKPFNLRELRSVVEIALHKHEAESRLKQSERRLAATLDSLRDGIVATDARGRVNRMNAAAVELTGWPLADAQGRPLDEVVAMRGEAGTERGLLIARDGTERR